ncbi:MAG: ATP-binding protein [Alphaproteobacteria bacterium]|nr:ATP-binding protein [Alphaproteobacteria bacterium]
MANKEDDPLVDQYRHAFEDAVFGVALVYPDGRWLKVNDAFSKMIGYSPEELYSIDFQSITHPDDLADDIVWITKVMEGENSVLKREKRYIHKDGHYIWINLTCSLYRDDEGQPGYFIAQIVDITELKIQQENLILAHKEAEEANQAKSDFLSAMSHELRTPLNSILGFAQLLNFDSGSEARKTYVEQILRGGEHLLELINEILELPKIESGQIELSIEAINTRQLIKDCQSFFTPLADEAKIDFSIEPFQNDIGKDIYLLTDPKRLKQVLINLISNAIKYNKEKGSVRVKQAINDDDTYTITVEDTGKGIPAKLHHKVFEPFNRLGAESSRIAGSGIGLTISKKLIEQMDGSIGFESTEGKGSTFWVTIPITNGDMVSQTQEILAYKPTEKFGLENKPFTALYIEDNHQNQALMKLIFDQFNQATLNIIHSGLEGIKAAKATLPDIILLDMGLPDINGNDVATRLKAIDLTAKIPIIAVSANAMPSDIQKSKTSKLDDYVTKPLKLNDFMKTISKHIK